MMYDSEARLIGEAQHIGSVISQVCTIAENQSHDLNVAQLAAGYFKAMLYDRKELAEKLWKELNKAYGLKALGNTAFKSIDDMAVDGDITVQEAAFCHNYLCQ